MLPAAIVSLLWAHVWHAENGASEYVPSGHATQRGGDSVCWLFGSIVELRNSVNSMKGDMPLGHDSQDDAPVLVPPPHAQQAYVRSTPDLIYPIM